MQRLFIPVTSIFTGTSAAWSWADPLPESGGSRQRGDGWRKHGREDGSGRATGAAVHTSTPQESSSGTAIAAARMLARSPSLKASIFAGRAS